MSVFARAVAFSAVCLTIPSVGTYWLGWRKYSSSAGGAGGAGVREDRSTAMFFNDTRLVRISAGFTFAAYVADTIPRALCLSLVSLAVPPVAVNWVEIVF